MKFHTGEIISKSEKEARQYAIKQQYDIEKWDLATMFNIDNIELD